MARELSKSPIKQFRGKRTTSSSGRYCRSGVAKGRTGCWRDEADFCVNLCWIAGYNSNTHERLYKTQVLRTNRDVCVIKSSSTLLVQETFNTYARVIFPVGYIVRVKIHLAQHYERTRAFSHNPRPPCRVKIRTRYMLLRRLHHTCTYSREQSESTHHIKEQRPDNTRVRVSCGILCRPKELNCRLHKIPQQSTN